MFNHMFHLEILQYIVQDSKLFDLKNSTMKVVLMLENICLDCFVIAINIVMFSQLYSFVFCWIVDVEMLQWYWSDQFFAQSLNG
jgi:hypothetical protein